MQISEFQPEILDVGKGKFVFSNYFGKRKNPQEVYLSKPVVVNGVIYEFEFYPNGLNTGKGTHISVGIRWSRLENLNYENEQI